MARSGASEARPPQTFPALPALREIGQCDERIARILAHDALATSTARRAIGSASSFAAGGKKLREIRRRNESILMERSENCAPRRFRLARQRLRLLELAVIPLVVHGESALSVG